MEAARKTREPAPEPQPEPKRRPEEPRPAPKEQAPEQKHPTQHAPEQRRETVPSLPALQKAAKAEPQAPRTQAVPDLMPPLEQQRNEMTQTDRLSRPPAESAAEAEVRVNEKFQRAQQLSKEAGYRMYRQRVQRSEQMKRREDEDEANRALETEQFWERVNRRKEERKKFMEERRGQRQRMDQQTRRAVPRAEVRPAAPEQAPDPNEGLRERKMRLQQLEEARRRKLREARRGSAEGLRPNQQSSQLSPHRGDLPERPVVGDELNASVSRSQQTDKTASQVFAESQLLQAQSPIARRRPGQGGKAQ